MKEKDIVSNDIALTFDFIRFAIKNPRILQQIPNGYDIRLLTKEFLKKEIDDETKKTINKKKTVAFMSNRVFKKVGS